MKFVMMKLYTLLVVLVLATMAKVINVPSNLDKYIYLNRLRDDQMVKINLMLCREPTIKELAFLHYTCRINNIDIITKNKLFIQLDAPHLALNTMFNVELGEYSDNGKTYVAHGAPVTIGADYPYVEHIMGLNTLPCANTYYKKASGLKDSTSFTPDKIATLYNFPADYNGKGQTVAIIELGGGYKESDLSYYFNYLKLNPTPQVVAELIDGATNDPTDVNASGEVVLDIEVVGAVANAANIVVYFAPNTTSGFYDAIYAAINDTKYNPSVISISWGGPENSWQTADMNSYNALLATAVEKNINVFVASGDSGASEGERRGLHVDFPASSPNVVACGGTRLDSNGEVINGETVWNDKEGASGGGISSVFSKPDYQNGTNASDNMRCIPDVVADADPETGYSIYLNGEFGVIGGTSAVAPLIAGLCARLNQHNGSGIKFMNIGLYENKPCVAITSGNNGYYDASSVYNCASGLGRIDGALALNTL
jgi:kumamolisin